MRSKRGRAACAFTCVKVPGVFNSKRSAHQAEECWVIDSGREWPLWTRARLSPNPFLHGKPMQVLSLEASLSINCTASLDAAIEFGQCLHNGSAVSNERLRLVGWCLVMSVFLHMGIVWTARPTHSRHVAFSGALILVEFGTGFSRNGSGPRMGPKVPSRDGRTGWLSV